MDRLIQAEAESAFPCIRCGECCRRYQVRLELAEAQRIADRLALALEQFRGAYADGRWPGTTSILLRREDGCCPFLEHSVSTGDDLCRIHHFKPSSCLEWTPGLDRDECQTGLATRWGIAVDASGQLRGSDDRMRDFRSLIDSLASSRRT